jgi:hypothetical protein
MCCNLQGRTMGEKGRREVAEMIRCWGGDEGATLVAARRTTTLGRCNLPLKPMSRNDVGFCRGMMGVFRGRPLSCWGWFPSRWRFPWKLGFHVPGLSSVGFLPLERSCTDSVITGIWAKSVNKRAIGLFQYRCRCTAVPNCQRTFPLFRRPRKRVRAYRESVVAAFCSKGALSSFSRSSCPPR